MNGWLNSLFVFISGSLVHIVLEIEIMIVFIYFFVVLLIFTFKQ